jgi:hypothetical protein
VNQVDIRANQTTRGIADIRGAAARAALHRSVTRPLRRHRRRLQRAHRSLGRLERSVPRFRTADYQYHLALAQTAGCTGPPIRPQTANFLTVVMAGAESALAATALARLAAPMFAVFLGSGIALTLVLLGKRLGHEIATFERLQDQSTRWGTIVALVAIIVVIAPLGLTLLRLGSIAAWPLLALAMPAGSATVTWLSYDAPYLHLTRSRRNQHRTAKAAHRIDRRLRRLIASVRNHHGVAETRFRARVGPAMRRLITDGTAMADDVPGHGRLLVLLSHDYLPHDPSEALAIARETIWSGHRSLPPPTQPVGPS